MLDRQRLTRYAPASALLLASIFFALSLLGYDPADPPGLGRPARQRIRRPTRAARWARRWHTSSSRPWAGRRTWSCSRSGGAVVLLFRRRAVPEKGVRLLGFALVRRGVGEPGAEVRPRGCSRAIRWAWAAMSGPWRSTVLEGQFGPAGMLLILLAAGLVGPGPLPRRAAGLAGPGTGPRGPPAASARLWARRPTARGRPAALARARAPSESRAGRARRGPDRPRRPPIRP